MKANQPVFEYRSRCCGAHADKEPCRRSAQEMKDGEWGKHSLGTWRCTTCSNPCTVDRRRPEKK